MAQHDESDASAALIVSSPVSEASQAGPEMWFGLNFLMGVWSFACMLYRTICLMCPKLTPPQVMVLCRAVGPFTPSSEIYNCFVRALESRSFENYQAGSAIR
jgi:hypothetical protein